MKQKLEFLLAIILAHFLLWLSFVVQPIDFWFIFSLSLFILALLAIRLEYMMWNRVKWLVGWGGLLTGIVLYGAFAIGKEFIYLLIPQLLIQLAQLYQIVAPIYLWQYILLFLVIIPGEELFWRGFVFKRLLTWYQPFWSILLSSMLYASANLFAGSFLLFLASIFAGIVWATLYHYTKNIWIVIGSHLLFDVCLLVLFPLL